MTKAQQRTATVRASRFHSFMKGWRHGAAAAAKDPIFLKHNDKTMCLAYEAGYQDGFTSRCAAAGIASKKYKHTPSPLREFAPEGER